MVGGTYEKTTARVVAGEGASDEYEVKIGLRQGSVLSPLLFIAVLDLINRKTAEKAVMRKLRYADDLTLVANGKQELHESSEEWNGLFTRHGLNMNLEKTEVVHIGHQRAELDIEMELKKLTQCVETGSLRERYVEEYRPERTCEEKLGGDGRPADPEKTKAQGHQHLCYTGMSVRNGKLGND